MPSIFIRTLIPLPSVRFGVALRSYFTTSCTEVGTQSPATCAKSLGILGILGIHDPQKDNQSSTYEFCALHTNFYLSDIYVAHINDEILIKARIGGIY